MRIGNLAHVQDAPRHLIGHRHQILGFDALPAGFRLRSLSDLPHLEWIYALADEGLLVDVDPRGLVVTDLGRDMATRPLEAWESVFEGLLDVGIAFWFRGQKGWHPAWTQLLDGALPDLLVLAYLNGREGLPSEEVVELAWSETARNLPGDEAAARKSLRSALASDVARLVEADCLNCDASFCRSASFCSASPIACLAVARATFRCTALCACVAVSCLNALVC